MRAKTLHKICPTCNRQFLTRHPSQVACSHVCGALVAPRGVDLTGRQFGRLTAKRLVRCLTKSGLLVRKWECDCACGGSTVPLQVNLMKGHTQSCGCIERERPNSRTHGHAAHGKLTPEYIAWRSMIQRCHDQKAVSYQRYGGLGIKVCAEWRESFTAFLEHVGPKPFAVGRAISLDRIQNDRDYEPGNVRWATAREQANNTRSNRLVTAHGVTRTLAEWSRVQRLRATMVWKRLNRGWTPERALELE